tara:strand:- start:1138 stop:1641 length:504 start_codon:yes stop_codon:yes gene_type:complete
MAIEFGNGTSLGNVLCDMWRIHSNFSGNQNPVANNWERADNANTGQNYSNVLTESSGIFSFTTLGWYSISFSHYFYANNEHADWTEMFMGLSTDSGSNYDDLGHTQGWMQGSGYHYNIPDRTIIFKVSDVSTHRMRFRIIVDNSSTITAGSTNRQHTGFCIQKIADL